MNAYLSIDIGTSAAKVSAYDADGSLLVSRSASYVIEALQAGWAEQDPDEWWRAVCSLTPQVMAAISGHRLAAISVCGQAPLCTPVDAHGRPLRKAILWLDRRATQQVDWLVEHVGEERCLRIGANRLDSYFGGLKWLWYRQNEPELFSRTWKIMQANGFVSWKLTGASAIDPTQAGLCSPCFDMATGQWDAAICETMGIPLTILPEIRPSQAVIGNVHAEAALASGLPLGTPVVCGAGDYACACLGAGVVRQGSAALMLGTAGNLLMPGASSPDSRLLHTQDAAGSPLTLGGVLAGGNLSWFAALFEDLSGGIAPDFFAGADDAAALVPAGSDGLLYLPYLMGERTPIWDPDARGAFVGLHQPSHASAPLSCRARGRGLRLSPGRGDLRERGARVDRGDRRRGTKRLVEIDLRFGAGYPGPSRGRGSGDRARMRVSRRARGWRVHRVRGDRALGPDWRRDPP